MWFQSTNYIFWRNSSSKQKHKNKILNIYELWTWESDMLITADKTLWKFYKESYDS